jgi:hypothetical protein
MSPSKLRVETGNLIKEVKELDLGTNPTGRVPT